MEDLTVIVTTLNKLPENWQRFYKKMILKAANGQPIITLSKKPMDYGLNVIQTEPESLSNIYFQILKGARLAKTKYVGVAEDDTVYPKSHFEFRPPLDTFAYNRTRWSILTWTRKKPFYYYKPRSGNCVLIAGRDILIEALEERFNKYPVLPRTCEPGSNHEERRMGITLRKLLKFYTLEPVVNLNHIYSHSPVERRKKKKAKPIRAYDIPYWGKVENIMKHYE